MNPFACQYTIIQFRPYVQTDEFANIGIVLVCPATGFVDYRIQLTHTKRLTDFFSPLQREDYLAAARYFSESLAEFKQCLQGQPPEALREQFRALVHPREAIIRLSQPRVLLTTNPAAELTRLYNDLVCHAFATREHVEDVMARSIAESLRALRLKHPFAPAGSIGDGALSFKLPLAQKIDGTLAKGIKPLNLDLQQPNDIFDKGASWSSRYQRLRNQLPHQVAFVVKLPNADTKETGIMDIAHETAEMLRLNTDATIITAGDLASLHAFAAQ